MNHSGTESLCLSELCDIANTNELNVMGRRWGLMAVKKIALCRGC